MNKKLLLSLITATAITNGATMAMSVKGLQGQRHTPRKETVHYNTLPQIAENQTMRAPEEQIVWNKYGEKVHLNPLTIADIVKARYLQSLACADNSDQE